jgi:electron transport complex protein RnfC
MRKTLRGIKLNHSKNTMGHETEYLPTPGEVRISMSQHIGASCEPLVAVGDTVKIGQKIGDTDAFVSAPVHSSVSGKVTSIEPVMSIKGTYDPMVTIKTDGKHALWEGIEPPAVRTREEFLAAVRESGVVGLGGAAFPASVKYAPKNLADVDTLIINGAECEPYITSDYRTMIEQAADVVAGAEIVMKHLETPHVCIGIESNKPKAIALLTELVKDKPIRVIKLRSLYPRGAERVLIYETTGKALPPGKLPADIGVLVSNVTSIAAIAHYFKTGDPLTRKRLTVDGDAVADPKNVMAPIGTKVYEIVDFCGGYKAQPRKLLMGGPMMGRSIYDDGKPIIKNNNAILAFSETEVAKMGHETQCINCGRCLDNCPIELMPTTIMRAYERGDSDDLKSLNVEICMECGCCSYVCPARKPLSLMNKMAKALIRESDAERSAAAAAAAAGTADAAAAAAAEVK